MSYPCLRFFIIKYLITTFFNIICILHFTINFTPSNIYGFMKTKFILFTLKIILMHISCPRFYLCFLNITLMCIIKNFFMATRTFFFSTIMISIFNQFKTLLTISTYIITIIFTFSTMG